MHLEQLHNNTTLLQMTVMHWATAVCTVHHSFCIACQQALVSQAAHCTQQHAAALATSCLGLATHMPPPPPQHHAPPPPHSNHHPPPNPTLASPPPPPGKATPHKLDKCTLMQAQAALSGQLVVARQQHADVCMQLQKEHAALQQAALQEHAIQKVTWPHLAAFVYPPCFGPWTHIGMRSL